MAYKSIHTGHAIDRAVAEIQGVNLEHLNHYLGLFSDLGTRPEYAEQAGDYCYVGTSIDCDEHHWNGYAWTVAQTHINLLAEVNNIVQELGDSPRLVVSQKVVSQLINDLIKSVNEQDSAIEGNFRTVMELKREVQVLSRTSATTLKIVDEHTQSITTLNGNITLHQQELDTLSAKTGEALNVNKSQQQQIDNQNRELEEIDNRTVGIAITTAELSDRTSALEYTTVRYKGLFVSPDMLPANPVSGDYAYVGSNVTALEVYAIVNSQWTATGEIIDLATVTNIDWAIPAEPSNSRVPSTRLLRKSIDDVKGTMVALTEEEYNALEIKDPNKFYFIYEE
jgi:hypothetical protein